jgi:hypothetical protein
MAISNNLFSAILAMDSYNRSYSQGLVVTGTQLGNAVLSFDSSELKDANQQRLDAPVSFFAQAYVWQGQTVISYRGTDNFVLDPLYGWLLGGGSYSVCQAEMAAEFDKHPFASGSNA